MIFAANLLEVINPGQGTAPPGVAGPVTTILQWTAWLVCALCVVGILAVAGKMALAHNHGRGGEHGQSLAFVLAACVLVASASGLVGVLV